MAETRGRADWAHTANILCLMANVNRDPKRHRPYRPQDFSPYRQPRRKSRKSWISVERLSNEIMAVAAARARAKGNGTK